MTKQTKLILGLGALGVILYILMRPKKPNVANKIVIDSNKPTIENYIKLPCSEQSNYCDYVIPKGTEILNAKIWGLGQALGGGGTFTEGQFEILRVVKDGVDDESLPFDKKLKIGKYELWRGAIVDIITTQDTTQSYQNREIIYT